MADYEVFVTKTEQHSTMIEIEDVADEDEAHDKALDQVKRVTDWDLDDTEYEVDDINELT